MTVKRYEKAMSGTLALETLSIKRLDPAVNKHHAMLDRVMISKFRRPNIYTVECKDKHNKPIAD
jgi:hypothetical protein